MYIQPYFPESFVFLVLSVVDPPFFESGVWDLAHGTHQIVFGAMFEQNNKIMDVGERPKPRTTDDYLN